MMVVFGPCYIVRVSRRRFAAGHERLRRCLPPSPFRIELGLKRRNGERCVAGTCEPRHRRRHSFRELGERYAIVDEVDSILIDEARTPLIISGPSEESTDKYYRIDKIVPKLRREIDYQVPDLLRRHRLIQDSVLSAYCAVMVFIASMFVIALAAATGSAWAATAALLIFLAGTAVLFLGILLTAIEVRTSHRSVRYEVNRVTDLMSSLTGQETHR